MKRTRPLFARSNNGRTKKDGFESVREILSKSDTEWVNGLLAGYESGKKHYSRNQKFRSVND